MIKERSYTSKLWGKKTRHFDFDTLEDLRELKERFKAVQIHKINDACTSFKTLARIKKELKDKTVLSGGVTVPMFLYLKRQNRIVKLANPYYFTCEVLRGYANTYKIEWQTKTELITAETKTNLWQNVTETIETGKNEYAKHTVRSVKLVPHRPQIIKTNHTFQTIHWSGGNVTTYNDDPSEEYVKAFDTCIFQGEKTL